MCSSDLILERDKAARALAEHLSAEHAEHPQATQLVIAHSHGGNIALRALHHSHKRDASQLCGAEMPSPLVVTMGTPFVEVQHSDFVKSSVIRFVVLYAMAYLVLRVLLFIWWGSPPDESATTSPYGAFPYAAFLYAAFFALLFAYLGWQWRDDRRAPVRQRQINALNDATRLGEVGSAQAQRMLIIRAIDDEASLTLALGTIVFYAIAGVIATVGIVAAQIIFAYLFYPYFLYSIIRVGIRFGLSSPSLGWNIVARAADIVAAIIVFLFSILMLARAAHGRELSWSPMECQINTHSTPDAIGLSKIVTLVRRTFVQSLRHGIYDYKECARTISDWVHSQVCTVPAR